MIFDTHIHLNDEKLLNNLDEYISNANKIGINKFLCVGWDIESSKKAIEIANKYDCVYAAISIMPTEHEKFNENSIKELEELAQNKKVVCIGETGLDYYWENTDEIKEKQKEMFIKHIELANKLNLPISVHCRDAYNDCLNIIKNFHVKRKSIMHCYSGSYELANEFIDQNFGLAFGGTLTYKNNEKTKKVIQNIDIKNVFFETDAPYLPPVPHRGEMNIPCYIDDTVSFASKLLNIKKEELENIVYKNSLEIFNLE